MKKTLLSFFTLISISVFSQGLTINPSGYYYQQAGDLCSAHFDVTNNLDDTLMVVVTRTFPEEYLTIDEISTYFCWGTTCYPPATNTSTNALAIAPGESPAIGFTGYLSNMPEEKTFTINYCFSVESDPTIKTCTDVNYTSLSAYIGVEETETRFEVYPNPANDILHVNYTSQKEADFIMYDMLGNKIYTDVIANSKTIQLYDFEAGIYFYTFSVNGKKAEVQKLVITH
tara:strand:- start:75 stop:761 length:687 start_codon:yes stop_codon:yes gene_type:complete